MGVMATTTKQAVWVVCRNDLAKLGPVLSTHRKYEAAVAQAARVRGSVESARVVALVQGGLPYTEAVQRCAGTPVALCHVEVG